MFFSPSVMLTSSVKTKGPKRQKNKQCHISCLIVVKKLLNSCVTLLLTALLQNNVGMTEALVDDSGYPRQDLDVYQVRNSRHTIICM
jgi:hypothetical protein